MENTFRSRGVIGMAATWAVGLALLATTVLVSGRALGVLPPDIFTVSAIVNVAGRALLAGGLAGALFALGLVRTGRSTSFSALTNWKVALWGLLGGVAIPAVLVGLGAGAMVPATVLIAGAVFYGALGAGAAVATLRIARRAPQRAIEAAPATPAGTLPPVI